MKISRGNVILQIGKTFWRYFATNIMSHSVALFINLAAWNSFFFSNNACLEFLLRSLQSGRSHVVPF